MKNSKEMSDSVIKRVSEHKEKQKKRKEKIKKASLAGVSMLAVFLIVAGVLKTGIFIKEKYGEKSIEIVKPNADISKNVLAQKHTSSSTESTTQKISEDASVIEKTTQSKDATTDSQGISETGKNSEENTASKGASRALETPHDVICYYDGKSGEYTSIHYRSLVRYINEYINGGNIGLFNFLEIESTIKTIRDSGKAIELIYNTEQEIEILLLDGRTETYKFDKVFFVLDGDYMEFMYFAQNGVYTIGPFKSSNVNCANRILTTIYPELLN